MNYFYILQSKKDSSYYYGSTINLRNRLNEHQLGKVFTTKSRLPVDLVYYEAYPNLQNARSREKQVKNSSSIRAALKKRLI